MARNFGQQFGQGLLSAARIMSPTEERRQVGLENKAEAKQTLMSKALLEGIASGAVNPAEAVPILKNFGMDDLIIGQAVQQGQQGQPQPGTGQSAQPGMGQPVQGNAMGGEIIPTGAGQAGIGGQRSVLGAKPEKEPVKAGVQFMLPDGSTEVSAFQKGSQFFYRDKNNALQPLPYNSSRAPSKELTGKMTTKLKNTIGTQQLQLTQGLDRLKEIEKGFNPDFTEVGTKASNKFNAFVEKTFGVNLSKANKKQLTEFTTFARNTIGNLNQHIRDRTGAVMNAAEIPRMMGEVPVIGDGIFDGDSATQFKAKLKGLIKHYEAAEARLKFVEANGLSPDSATRDETGQWVTSSSSGYSLDEFRNLPAKPQQFDDAGWNAMQPTQRRRLVELMNRKKK